MGILNILPQVLQEAKNEYEKCTPERFIPVERYGSETDNILAQGDCLPFMKYLMEEKNMKGRLQLIYADPPFFTKANYSATVKSACEEKISAHAYSDVWEEGELAYYRMLCARLYAMRDLLSEEGCIWIHLDWHAVHCVKLLMDEIFGADNFVNEVIWTYKSGGSTKKHFARKHDTLLFYSRSRKYYFEPQKEKSYNRGYKPYRFRGVEEFEDELGWYTMVNMKDVWNIDMVGRTSSERTGYATQKPKALIDRIVRTCSRPGDICADFFAGSSTLAVSAADMGRQFIVCDNGDLAAEMSIKRLHDSGVSFDFYKFCDVIVKKSDDISINSDIIRISVFGNNTEPVDMWSVDPDYDGKIHRAAYVFKRSKKDIETELRLRSEQISMFDCPGIRLGTAVSILVYSITGGRKHMVLDVDHMNTNNRVPFGGYFDE